MCRLQVQESPPLDSSNTEGAIAALNDMGRPHGQVRPRAALLGVGCVAGTVGREQLGGSLQTVDHHVHGSSSCNLHTPAHRRQQCTLMPSSSQQSLLIACSARAQVAKPQSSQPQVLFQAYLCLASAN